MQGEEIDRNEKTNTHSHNHTEYKKAMLSQGNRAMPQLFFSV